MPHLWSAPREVVVRAPHALPFCCLVLIVLIFNPDAAVSRSTDSADGSNNSGFSLVANGRDLALALADPLVTDIVLEGSVTLKDDDWVGLGELPILLERNVTIVGSPELVAVGDLPVFNCSFVKNKLKLPGGVTLNLTGVVLTWYREDLPSSTPGMDLLTYSTTDTATNITGGQQWPLLVWYKIALNNRLCFPESWSRQSVNATKRPDAIPGVQSVTFDLPQPGCRNDNSTGPWLARCYPVRRRYVDVAAYGASYSATGSFVRTGYLVHAVGVDLLCSGVMTDNCLAQYGAVGCFYSVFPKNKVVSNSSVMATAAVVQEPIQAAAAAGAVSPAANGGGGDGGEADEGERRWHMILIAVLCSALGAAVAIAATLGVLLLLRNRRLRRLADNQLEEGRRGHSSISNSRKANGERRSSSSGDRTTMDDSAGVSTEAMCEHAWQPHSISLDVTAPGLGGGQLPRPALQGCQARVVNTAAASAETKGNGGAAGAGSHAPGRLQQQQQQHPPDPVAEDAPVTLQTPPRPDMQLLADPFRPAVDNEVKLLPHATRGAGAFGRVVEGVFKGERVAVKLIADAHHGGGPSDTLLRSFAQEVEVLCRCAHPNVVRLLAACLTPPRVCLVMELMETSLDRIMYPPPPPSQPPQTQHRPMGRSNRPRRALLPLTTVLHIALEIAKGLEYLHPTIVHRDLKPANVLVNDPTNVRPVIKLTDFGLSRLRSTEAPTLTPDAGTPAYLSPEGLDPTNHVITHKADIYSLAILMWEMVAGERPWRDCNMLEMAIKVTLQGCRPSLKSFDAARCPPRLRQLIARCWEGDPLRRPAAAEVTKCLVLIMQEIALSVGDGKASKVIAAAEQSAPVAPAARGRGSKPPPELNGGESTPDASAAAAAEGPAANAAPRAATPAAIIDLQPVTGGQQHQHPQQQSDARVLNQEVNTDVVAEIANAAERVSPETLPVDAAPTSADPAAVADDDEDDEDTIAYPGGGGCGDGGGCALPPPPAQPDPIIVPLAAIMNKHQQGEGIAAVFGGSIQREWSQSQQQQQCPAGGGWPRGNAFVGGGDDGPLCPYALIHGGGGPRACELRFLGSSAFATWARDRPDEPETTGPGPVAAAAGAPPPAATAAGAPSQGAPLMVRAPAASVDGAPTAGTC